MEAPLPVAWGAGAAPVREAVELWLAGRGAGAELLRESGRRRVARLPDPTGGALLVKLLRGALGSARARREERRLRALRRAGVAVPDVLARGRAPGGAGLLVLRWLDGTCLAEGLPADAAARRGLLEALGREVARLHAAGFVHGDLHLGNVLASASGPVLLDLGRSRRARGRAARVADLAALDFALRGRASRPDRLRLRAAALGLRRPFDAAAQQALRRAADATHGRAHAHAARRTRRALRPGAEQARVQTAQGRGLRWHEFRAEAVREALSEHAAALAAGDARILQDTPRSRLTAVRAGGRPVVVKQVLARGPARPLADLVRGSAARRAWRGGHGLRLRGLGAALPLAFVEHRRLGVPLASWVVLEDLRGDRDALAACREDPAAVADALGALLLALHQRGVRHGDLKATHVLLRAGALGAPFEARLLDLEGVRFRRRLSDRERIEALAQLNASLPDCLAARDRQRAFRRYARSLPFTAEAGAVLDEIVRRSVARRHRWSGAGCLCGAPATARNAAGRGA